MDLNTLNRYYEEGWLIKQTHPELPLTIWNYSQSTQFERKWDEITLQCRGLVTDDEGNVVARPFRKFFNIEEGRHNSTKDFRVYEKMDGSLIIAFYYNDEFVVASRGSFTSDQAEAARLIFDKLKTIPLPREYTYMFEFTAPWNRIVVDYGRGERLTLLGIQNTETGEELPMGMVVEVLNSFYPALEKPFLEVKEYDNVDDYSVLKNLVKDNQEGFVIHFSNGDRCKIKGEEYIRLHGIMTNASTTSVWEVLKNQDSMEQYLQEVPDEFYEKIKTYKQSLEDEYWEIASKVKSIFNTIYEDGMSAREFSTEVRYLDKAYQGLLWSQFNVKMINYSETIWNHIRPEFRKL
jgi:RNA ligase